MQNVGLDGGGKVGRLQQSADYPPLEEREGSWAVVL